jgi:hypothetical protein
VTLHLFGVNVQPSYEIKLHPVDLSVYGKTPAGAPIYRVVWAETRKTKLLYKGKIRIIPRYLAIDKELADIYDLAPAEKEACTRNMQAHWILERWKSSEEFVGVTREQYQAMRAQFPWAPDEGFPEDGEYDFEAWFPSEIDEALLHRAIAEREYRRNNVRLVEKQIEAVAADELKEVRQDQAFTELCEQAREESFIQ